MLILLGAWRAPGQQGPVMTVVVRWRPVGAIDLACSWHGGDASVSLGGAGKGGSLRPMGFITCSSRRRSPPLPLVAPCARLRASQQVRAVSGLRGRTQNVSAAPAVVPRGAAPARPNPALEPTRSATAALGSPLGSAATAARSAATAARLAAARATTAPSAQTVVSTWLGYHPDRIWVPVWWLHHAGRPCCTEWN
jgi:hypothetical protein